MVKNKRKRILRRAFTTRYPGSTKIYVWKKINDREAIVYETY